MSASIADIEQGFDRMRTAPNQVVEHLPGPNPSNRPNRLEGSVESTEICFEGDCERAPVARGLCNPHYKQHSRSGTLPAPMSADEWRAVRFWRNVEKTTTCWLWRGSLSVYGYGQFGTTLDGRKVNLRAHRFAWELLRGAVPDEMVLDHVCRDRSCVNPDHLEVVTHRENVVRGIGPSAINARKTHCKRGHEFTDENTLVEKRGSRVCRTCRSDRFGGKYQRERRKAAKSALVLYRPEGGEE